MRLYLHVYGERNAEHQEDRGPHIKLSVNNVSTIAPDELPADAMVYRTKEVGGDSRGCTTIAALDNEVSYSSDVLARIVTTAFNLGLEHKEERRKQTTSIR